VFSSSLLRRTPAFRRVLADAERDIDMALVRELEDAVRHRHNRVPGDASKFLDCRRWLPRNVERAFELELQHSVPLTILDIGCGAGYFLLVARSLGHDVIGLDVPPDGFADDLQRLVFPGLLRALRLEDRVVCIRSNASRHPRSQLDK
jgi:SAM-dependent methyltransferase